MQLRDRPGPVASPLSWFSEEEGNLLVRAMRRAVLKPVIDATLQSCECHVPGPVRVQTPLLVTAISTNYYYNWSFFRSSFVIFASCDLTNISILCSIPGPLKKPITMHGEVVQWTATPPQAGAGTIGMRIMSYDGGISIGVSADLVRASRGGYATKRSSSSGSSYTSQGRRGFRPELGCGVSSSRV